MQCVPGQIPDIEGVFKIERHGVYATGLCVESHDLVACRT